MQSDAVVYIVDDDEAVRKSLGLLLKSTGQTSKLCDSAEAFLDCYDPSRPGCMLLDIRMPGMSGLELQEKLSSRGIHLPVVIMTGHGDIAMTVRAMKAGARDFIEKPFQNQVLMKIIQESLEDEADKWKCRETNDDALQRLALLTPRQRDVMQLLVDGKLNKQVAYELNISVRTVEVHRARLMKKLKVRSLSELVRLSILENSLGTHTS
jgi:two-component system, LuxR family, response regulator FixJ